MAPTGNPRWRPWRLLANIVLHAAVLAGVVIGIIHIHRDFTALPMDWTGRLVGGVAAAACATAINRYIDGSLLSLLIRRHDSRAHPMLGVWIGGLHALASLGFRGTGYVVTTRSISTRTGAPGSAVVAGLLLISLGELVSSSLVACLTCCILFFQLSQLPFLLLAAAAAAAGSGATALGVAPIPRFLTDARRVSAVATRIANARSHHGRWFHVSPMVLGLNLVSLALHVARFWFVCYAIGASPSLLSTTAAVALADLLSLASMVPGGLGVREGCIAVLAGALGLTEAEAVTAALLDRLVTTAIRLLQGGLSLMALRESNQATADRRSVS